MAGTGPDNRTEEHGRRPGTLRIGQIGGIDVYVRASWLLVAVLIAVLLAPRIEAVAPGLGWGTYLAGLAFAVLLYLSVLLHELSHALMARRFGLPVRAITLHFLGGVTEIEREADTPRRELVVAAVGPVTSIAVGLVSLGVGFLMPSGLLAFAMNGLAFANLVVGVLNLVPGLPLDGGRVLRAVVWAATGRPHLGTMVAGWAGRVVALVALSWPLLQMPLLGVPPTLLDYAVALVIALFLWGGANAAIMSARIRRRLPALEARPLARRALHVPDDLPLAEAVRRAQEAQAGALVTVATDGRPLGVVNEAALLAVPEDRRPWMPVSGVARSLEPGLLLPVSIRGEDLVRAMQRTPATEYLLVEPGGAIFGVLSTKDVDRAFAATA